MRLTILILVFTSSLYGQQIPKKSLQTEITEVTVFLEGAQIKRKGTVNLLNGKTLLNISKLSPYVDEKSIQVKGTGEFKIISVNSKVNFLDQLSTDLRKDSITSAIDRIDDELEILNSRNSVLNEKVDLLNQNKLISGDNSSLSLVQLRDAMAFFDKELTNIKNEQRTIRKRTREKREKLETLERELINQGSEKRKATSEIQITVETIKSGKAEFEISYLVKNAGWFPKYDIRASNIAAPIEIDYKAQVYQNTGNEWNNVKLRFSNGNPNEGGSAPVLSTWFLNYARLSSYRSTQSVSTPGFITGRITSAEDGAGLPGVNVIVKGTTIGTVSDLNGNYSLARPSGDVTLVYSFIGLATEEIQTGNRNVIDVQMSEDVQQLSEVVVLQGRAPGLNIKTKGVSRRKEALGYAVLDADINQTEIIENQTTVQIEVTEPYSVKSNGERIQVDLKQYEIEALFEYYAVPKLDNDAFLIAKILDWDQYNFLAGEANLYFEGAYVGRSILDTKTLNDTLEISLGRDKSILVNRTKLNEESKKRFIGSNITETRSYKFEVRNRKSLPIKLVLVDQLPKAINYNISVEPQELSEGEIDEETNKVTWELNVSARENIMFNFGYEVKYPKRERVILD